MFLTEEYISEPQIAFLRFLYYNRIRVLPDAFKFETEVTHIAVIQKAFSCGRRGTATAVDEEYK